MSKGSVPAIGYNAVDSQGGSTMIRVPMARKVRIQYAGAVYHVMNRGDRREAIFGDDKDRELFLSTLGQACRKTGWQVHAYC